MASGIKHLVYVGTPYCSLTASEKCRYLLGKEKVEAHVVSSGEYSLGQTWEDMSRERNIHRRLELRRLKDREREKEKDTDRQATRERDMVCMCEGEKWKVSESDGNTNGLNVGERIKE